MTRKDILIFISFSLFFLLALGFLYVIQNEGSKCLLHPTEYTYKNINPQPLFCYCQMTDSRIYFNDTSLEIVRLDSSIGNIGVNINLSIK